MGRLFQGVGTGTNGIVNRAEGTNTFFVIKSEDIPKDRLNEICYNSVVCEVRPGKKDPNRTRITICGKMSATQETLEQTQPHLNSSNLRSTVYYQDQDLSMCVLTLKNFTSAPHLGDQNM